MNNFVDTVKIELKKKTPEELSEKICELVTDNIIKDKEIEKLNNIINRMEEDLKEVYMTFGEFNEEYTEKKISELKEGKECLKKIQE